MLFPHRLAFILALLLPFTFAPVHAQNESEKIPSLNDAKTFDDVNAYYEYAISKADLRSGDPKKDVVTFTSILIPVCEKLLEVAKDDQEKTAAYSRKMDALFILAEQGIEGAEQKCELYLKELESLPDVIAKDVAKRTRFDVFARRSQQTVNTPQTFAAFKTELKSWLNQKDSMANAVFLWFRVAEPQATTPGQFPDQFAKELIEFFRSAECTLSAEEKTFAVEETEGLALEIQFHSFATKTMGAVNTPEKFVQFKSELKEWINKKVWSARSSRISQTVSLGLWTAERCKVPAVQFVEEIVKFIQSAECTLPASEKEMSAKVWEGTIRRAMGSDLKLYGKTLDNKDFDWKSLRGKYVLVMFTATWCGHCHGEIPHMREVYAKYHDKGFEIVSVYVQQRDTDPVAAVRKHVEEEKLPWIILSEFLTEKAGQPKQGDFYAIYDGVPEMFLLDKEGKIIMKDARGNGLKAKLAEIFR